MSQNREVQEAIDAMTEVLEAKVMNNMIRLNLAGQIAAGCVSNPTTTLGDNEDESIFEIARISLKLADELIGAVKS